MHPLMVKQIVKDCQRRSDTDCAGASPFTIETLEDCITQLASDVAAERERVLSTLATALRAFAPDLAADLATRWREAKLTADERLERFLEVLRKD